MDHHALPAAIRLRHPSGDDHAAVLAALDDWWGGLGGEAGAQQRRLLLPRLWFDHFADTSWLAADDDDDDALAGFLVGFLSPARPDTAYIHFVGVDPGRRRAGLAAALYGRFLDHARARGRRVARCITSPGNRTSVAFHTSLGFTVDDGDAADGAAVQRDYDGPGVDRVTFTLRL